MPPPVRTRLQVMSRLTRDRQEKDKKKLRGYSNTSRPQERQVCPGRCQQRQLGQWSPLRRFALGHRWRCRSCCCYRCAHFLEPPFNCGRHGSRCRHGHLQRSAGCSPDFLPATEFTQHPPTAPRPPIASLPPWPRITAGCPRAQRPTTFLGITDEELGQNASAETELKAASGAWDRNQANLAKLALAGLYRQTSRDSQAIDIYNALVAKPSETVPAAVAQLGLADLYVAEGKQDQARALWAKVKDADKEGAAGSIATQKLAAK